MQILGGCFFKKNCTRSLACLGGGGDDLRSLEILSYGSGQVGPTGKNGWDPVWRGQLSTFKPCFSIWLENVPRLYG